MLFLSLPGASRSIPIGYSSSFLGVPYRSLNTNHKKELLWLTMEPMGTHHVLPTMRPLLRVHCRVLAGFGDRLCNRDTTDGAYTAGPPCTRITGTCSVRLRG